MGLAGELEHLLRPVQERLKVGACNETLRHFPLLAQEARYLAAVVAGAGGVRSPPRTCPLRTALAVCWCPVVVARSHSGTRIDSRLLRSIGPDAGKHYTRGSRDFPHAGARRQCLLAVHSIALAPGMLCVGRYSRRMQGLHG